MSIPADRTIVCRDCQQPFVFTTREQEFFSERGFGAPVRCVPCRRAHKAKRNAGSEGPGANGVSSDPRPRQDFPRQNPGYGPGPGAPTGDRDQRPYRQYGPPGGPQPVPAAPEPPRDPYYSVAESPRDREQGDWHDSDPYSYGEGKKPKKKRQRFYEAEPDEME